MIRFDEFKRLAWSILVVGTLAFALGACEGDDAPSARRPGSPPTPTQARPTVGATLGPAPVGGGGTSSPKGPTARHAPS